MAKEKQVASLQLPDAGAVFIRNGDANELTLPEGYEFTELFTVTDCTFNKMTPIAGFRVEGLDGMIIPPGVPLHVRALSFKLNAGSLIAYYAKSVDKRATAQ